MEEQPDRVDRVRSLGPDAETYSWPIALDALREFGRTVGCWGYAVWTLLAVVALGWHHERIGLFWSWLWVGIVWVLIVAIRSFRQLGWDHLQAERRPYFLLLRSISNARTYRGTVSRFLMNLGITHTTPATVFEDALALAMASIGPLISVQRTREYGSHRWIHIDGGEFWADVVEVLMEHAHGILIIPGISPGVESEAAFLAERHFQKAIVLIPPKEAGASEGTWEEIRERWANVGYRLPPFDEGGQIYLAGPAFAPRSMVRLRMPTMTLMRNQKLRRIIGARLRAALEDVLSEIPPGGAPLADVAETAERASLGELHGVLSERLTAR
jgi:hypothetical protein